MFIYKLKMVKFTTDQLHTAMTQQYQVRNMSIVAHVDSGKCFCKGTKIPLHNGTYKNVENIIKGDKVLGDHDNFVTVTGVHNGTAQLYEIQQTNGNSYTTNGNHVLMLKDINNDIHEISVHDYHQMDDINKQKYYGYKVPFHFETNKQIKNYLSQLVHRCGAYNKDNNTISLQLDKYDIRDDPYDIAFKARSLGIIVDCHSEMDGFPVCNLYGTVMEKISLNGGLEYRANKNQRSLLCGITVTQTEIGEYYGFEVDDNHRHLLPDFTVCHNTTITDSLLNAAGMMSDDATGERRGTDTRDDEQARCITIKSTGISLYYEMDDDNIPEGSKSNKFLINLIDSPGHVDFSSEVTAALRVTDGAMIILGAVKGICVQTVTVLKQALDEMIVPVCAINKIDRLILEKKLPAEDIYQQLYKHVRDLNDLIAKHNHKMPELTVDPTKESVCFSCGKQGWGFSLRSFAKKWYKKLNLTIPELMDKLWGENFYNPKTKEWAISKKKGSYRSFNLFCLKPIIGMMMAVENDDKETVAKIIADLKIPKADLESKKGEEKREKKLMKTIMQKFLPHTEALLSMIVHHLPDPVTAQKYRVDNLYTGPKDDKFYEGIKNCDPNGPLVMYVSKLFPTHDLSRFYAYGRVFSGTISAGDVYIQGPEFQVGNHKKDFFKGRVQSTEIMMGASGESIPDCPAGNIISLSGVDKWIAKSATITNELDCHNIKMMKFSVSPVVSVAVSPKNYSDIDKLSKGLRLLSKSDPLCKVTMDKNTGEIIISGAGELHLEICVQDLREFYTKGVELNVSDPVVPYRETITDISPICLAKSPNSHNRIYLRAQPINMDLCNDILDKKIGMNQEPKDRSRFLVENYDWDKVKAAKIWDISEIESPNMILDDTKGVQYLHEIKDSLKSGFRHSIESGPLCDEPIFGVQFELQDVTLHADAIHRGMGQLLPPTRRAMFATLLTGKPRLLEPYYHIEITCPCDVSSKIYGFLTRKRGSIESEETDYASDETTITGFLPVAESIGFAGDLRGATGGKAFPQCTFSHWDIINSDPLEEGSVAYELVSKIRKRKDLSERPMPLEKYKDKL
jgi:elongation factor 2